MLYMAFGHYIHGLFRGAWSSLRWSSTRLFRRVHKIFQRENCPVSPSYQTWMISTTWSCKWNCGVYTPDAHFVSRVFTSNALSSFPFPIVFSDFYDQSWNLAVIPFFRFSLLRTWMQLYHQVFFHGAGSSINKFWKNLKPSFTKPVSCLSSTLRVSVLLETSFYSIRLSSFDNSRFISGSLTSFPTHERQ